MDQLGSLESGAGFMDLYPNVIALVILAAILVSISTRAFRKTIS